MLGVTGKERTTEPVFHFLNVVFTGIRNLWEKIQAAHADPSRAYKTSSAPRIPGKRTDYTYTQEARLRDTIHTEREETRVVKRG